eukprot:CAMPEP_0169109476 /NCGR_PEP_ID=MMETSP1015-20121227/25985_1 /TAXON_ID=342587 /ORGANISM="Karlodinium micrum, Strain CCMP2283" /LENGTH=273 /DNA_ID=CAMNT_0009171175 /DNA_START=62 /DNA_END=884 /DNA_ORIENTATION=-
MTSASSYEKNVSVPASTEVPEVVAAEVLETSLDTVSSYEESGSRQELVLQQRASEADKAVTDPEIVQQQISATSKRVLMLETSIVKDVVGTFPTSATPNAQAGVSSLTEIAPRKEPKMPTSTTSGLPFYTYPCLDIGASLAAEHDLVLKDAAEVLDSTPGVLDTRVCRSMFAGTLATLHIRMFQTAEGDSARIAAVAKASILEAAARSQRVYVFGYEATPFVDEALDVGFSGTLAIASGQDSNAGRPSSGDIALVDVRAGGSTLPDMRCSPSE